ncbi:hypothetical protein AYO38_04740 [bacterium SCGC AG-212-C10]|nr:hypothetical protein AYO38_04740 [bacterium SCGC AG-212-C10]
MDNSDWQASLPLLVDRCAERWSLTLGDRLDGGALAEVRGCTGPNGEDLVLKMSPPMAKPAYEAAALAHWRGHGAAKLVAWDADDGALLLKRVRPGTFLMERDRSTPDDELAIRAASQVLRALQSAPAPAGGTFPSFEERMQWWLEFTARYGEADAVGTRMLPLIERAALRLHASTQRQTLAHGDFVAKNMLLGTNGYYVAIDPLPLIADPCLDIGQFTAYHSPVATVLDRARSIADATGNDRDRAEGWAAVWTAFQACETWREDSDDVQRWAVGEDCQRLLRT